MKTITFSVPDEEFGLLRVNARRQSRPLASYVRALVFVRLGMTPEENTPPFKERRRQLVDGLKSVPCADCKQTFPPISMDFDHRDPRLKGFNVSAGIYGNEQLLLDEIAKCDVVCSNCHRIRTHPQRVASFPVLPTSPRGYSCPPPGMEDLEEVPSPPVAPAAPVAVPDHKGVEHLPEHDVKDADGWTPWERHILSPGSPSYRSLAPMPGQGGAV